MRGGGDEREEGEILACVLRLPFLSVCFIKLLLTFEQSACVERMEDVWRGWRVGWRWWWWWWRAIAASQTGKQRWRDGQTETDMLNDKKDKKK